MENKLCENCCGDFDFRVKELVVTCIVLLREKNDLIKSEMDTKYFCGENCLREWLNKEINHD